MLRSYHYYNIKQYLHTLTCTEAATCECVRKDARNEIQSNDRFFVYVCLVTTVLCAQPPKGNWFFELYFFPDFYAVVNHLDKWMRKTTTAHHFITSGTREDLAIIISVFLRVYRTENDHTRSIRIGTLLPLLLPPLLLLLLLLILLLLLLLLPIDPIVFHASPPYCTTVTIGA